MRSQPSATPSPPASKSISRSFTTGKTVSHLSLNNRLPPYNLCHILTVLTVQSIIKKTPRLYRSRRNFCSLLPSPTETRELVISILSSRESRFRPIIRFFLLPRERIFLFLLSLFFFRNPIDSRITHNSGLDRSGKINFNRETRSVNVMINFSGGTSQRIEVVGNRTS